MSVQLVFSQFFQSSIVNVFWTEFYLGMYILKEIRYKMYTEFILLVSDDTRNPEW